jgi:hypothetical protein
MNIDSIQTKTKNDTVNDYYSQLCDKLTNNVNLSKKLEKIDDADIYIPKFGESEYLLRYNYNVNQLKLIAKTYKLKLSGNKPQLVSRIYAFLNLSYSAIKIQKIIRGCLQRKYVSFHGPAFTNKSLCTNAFDFLSMEPLTDIPNEQFFSFKDDDGFIYGFDLLSLYNLIYKSNGVVKNPFNTKPIGQKVIENFRSLLRLSRVFHVSICTEISDVTKEVSDKKSVELRALTLFQNIDALGNYSNAQWFLSLNRNMLIKFLRELVDIWSYRAPLTLETKRAICPPSGNPFQRMQNYNILQTMENLDDVRKIILETLETLVTTGIDKDSKCLGAYYILGALTLVNSDAATSLPWLYQAVCYM